MKKVWKRFKKSKGNPESSKTAILNINGKIEYAPNKVSEALASNIKYT